jgi:hypothetical protein
MTEENNVAMKIDWFQPSDGVEEMNNNCIPLIDKVKSMKKNSQKSNKNPHKFNDNESIYI